MDLTRKYCIISSSGTSAGRVQCRYLVGEVSRSAHNTRQSKGHGRAVKEPWLTTKNVLIINRRQAAIQFLKLFLLESFLNQHLQPSASCPIGCKHQPTDVSNSDPIRKLSKILNMWGDAGVITVFSMIYSTYGSGEFVHAQDRHAWRSSTVFAAQCMWTHIDSCPASVNKTLTTC